MTTNNQPKSIVLLGIAVLTCALFFVAWIFLSSKLSQDDSQDNFSRIDKLNHLFATMAKYTDSHGDKFPNCKTWLVEVFANTKEYKEQSAVSLVNLYSQYAINPNICNKSIDGIGLETPIIVEYRANMPSQAVAERHLIGRGNSRRCAYITIDGVVKFRTQDEIWELISASRK